jgi:hypothetical protein
MADWALSLPEGRQIFISNEGLLGQPTSGYDKSMETLGYLANRFKGRDWRVVVFFRAQWDWLPSVYLQTLQEGGSDTPEQFWSGITDLNHFRWMTLIRQIESFVGPGGLRVGVLGAGHDPVVDFFELCRLGVVPPTPSGAIRENVSVSAPQGVLLRAINADPTLTQAERTRVRVFFQSQSRTREEARLSPFDLELQEEVFRAYSPDWASLGEWLHAHPSSCAVTNMDPTLVGPSIRPFAGSSFDAPDVAREISRCLRDSALTAVRRDPSIIRRFQQKVVSSPSDVLPAAMRRLRRRLVD